MPNTILSFDKEARDKLASGADKLAKAVVSTLGPRSRNVAVNGLPTPRVLHDGVSVARSIKLKDPLEDMGASLLREAASKTNDLAGDGTTTATLLANTLLQEGLKLIHSGIDDGVVSLGLNPMELKESLLEYSQVISGQLDKMAKKIKTLKDMEKVAAIASGDPIIGALVAKALKSVGDSGLVMVEQSSDFESSIDYQKGMEFSNGYLSPQFVTDPHRMIADYSGGGHYVLLTDQSIADGLLLVPIIEKIIKAGQNKKALLVIAGDVVGPALQAMVLTKLKSQVPLVAVMAPEYADRRKEMLEDIAVLTGGVVISQDQKMDLRDVKLGDLGRLRNLKVTQNKTVITPDNPDNEEIKDRCEAIKEQIEAEDNNFKKERLQFRLAKLSQSVATINVGGASETEIDEKRERVIDAIHATKAAISDGIVPGGGVALRDIARTYDKVSEIDLLVSKALCGPFGVILSNSGIEAGSYEQGEGVDVITKESVNMIDKGIVDPVKVTKLAVKHAFSVAGMMLTTDSLISPEPDEGVQKIKVVNQNV